MIALHQLVLQFEYQMAVVPIRPGADFTKEIHDHELLNA